jgi:hypothetical protein
MCGASIDTKISAMQRLHFPDSLPCLHTRSEREAIIVLLIPKHFPFFFGGFHGFSLGGTSGT